MGIERREEQVEIILLLLLLQLDSTKYVLQVVRASYYSHVSNIKTTSKVRPLPWEGQVSQGGRDGALSKARNYATREVLWSH